MRALLLLLIPALAHADPCDLDAYNRDPTGPDAARVLFEAGACFAQSRAVGASVQAFELLRKSFANSPYARKAYPLLAQGYDAAGRFADAAAVWEEYSAKFAAEADAADALRNAVTYRLALGDDKKAIDDGKRFLKTYGAKQAEASAQVALQIAPAMGAQEAAWLATASQQYKLSDAQQLHALARRAELAWSASCKGRELCVSPLPPDKLQRCAQGERIRVDRRTGGDAAQALLAKARALYAAKGDALARHDGAMVELRIADAKLEAYLAIPAPTGLDFDRRRPALKEQSTKRFDDWIGKVTKDGGEVSRAYEAILALKDPVAAIAAAERRAIVTRQLAVQLATAEIPKDIRTGDFAKDAIQGFCDQMKEVAEPLEKRSQEAFTTCATKANELAVDPPAAQRCRAAIHAVEPVLPPLHGAPVAPQLPLPAAKFSAITSCAKVSVTDDESQYFAGYVAARCGGDARAIWSKSGSAKAHAALGVLAWQRGDATTAAGEWEAARALDGKLALAHYGRALTTWDSDEKVTVEALTNAAAAGDATAEAALAVYMVVRGHPQLARLYQLHVPDDARARAAVELADGNWAAAAAAFDGYDGALAAMHLRHADEALRKLPKAKTYDELIVHGAAQLLLLHRDEARRDFTAAQALDPSRREAAVNLDLAK